MENFNNEINNNEIINNEVRVMDELPEIEVVSGEVENKRGFDTVSLAGGIAIGALAGFVINKGVSLYRKRKAKKMANIKEEDELQSQPTMDNESGQTNTDNCEVVSGEVETK